jgi:ribosome-binding factor A
VEVTKKLERAVIFFSLLEDKNEQEVEKKLNALNYFFRKKLAGVISIRKTPELHFQYDKKSSYFFQINKKLSEL